MTIGNDNNRPNYTQIPPPQSQTAGFYRARVRSAASMSYLPARYANNRLPNSIPIMSRSVAPMPNTRSGAQSIKSLQDGIQQSMVKLDQTYNCLMLMNPQGGFHGLQGRPGMYYKPPEGELLPINAEANNIPADAKNQLDRHDDHFKKRYSQSVSSLYQHLAYHQYQIKQQMQQLASAGVKNNMTPQEIAKLLPAAPSVRKPIALNDIPGVYSQPMQAGFSPSLPKGCEISAKDGTVRGFPGVDQHWEAGSAPKIEAPKSSGLYYMPTGPKGQQKFRSPYDIKAAWNQWLAKSNYQQQSPEVFPWLKPPDVNRQNYLQPQPKLNSQLQKNAGQGSVAGKTASERQQKIASKHQELLSKAQQFVLKIAELKQKIAHFPKKSEQEIEELKKLERGVKESIASLKQKISDLKSNQQREMERLKSDINVKKEKLTAEIHLLKQEIAEVGSLNEERLSDQDKLEVERVKKKCNDKYQALVSQLKNEYASYLSNMKKELGNKYRGQLNEKKKKIVVERNSLNVRRNAFQGELQALSENRSEMVKKHRAHMNKASIGIETEHKQSLDTIRNQKEIVIKKLEEEISDLNEKIDNSQEMDEIITMSKGIDDLQITQSTMQKENAKLLKEKQDMAKQISINNKRLAGKEASLAKVKPEFIRLKDYGEKKQQAIFKVQNDVAMLKEKIKKKQDDAKQIKKKTENMRVEGDSKKTEISRILAERLVVNNPQITDLSDQNRPSKLADQLAECYDNAWTNCFEQLDTNEVSGVDSIKLMYDFVREFHAVATDLVSKKREEIQKLCGGNVPLRLLAQFHKKLKSTAFVESNLPEVFKVMETKNSKALSGLRNFSSDDPSDAIATYINEIARIVLLGAVQDPPLVFEFGNHGDKFDKKTMKEYLKSGDTIDYCVWPVVYLNQGGPLLQKGIAQPISSKK